MTQADDTPAPAAEMHEQVKHATDQAAEGAREAVSATAEAADRTTQEAATAGSAAADRAFAFGSQTASAFDAARSRLGQAGFPGIAESQGMVDQFKAGSELLSKRMREEFGQTQKTASEFNAKVVEAWRTNAEATIAYWQRLAGVTNWSDLVALNTAHLRQQMETVTAQTRELAELATKAARDGAESMGKMPR